MNFRLLLTVGCAVSLLAVLVWQADPALAAEQTTTQYLVAPEDEVGKKYQQDVASSRVETEVGYIDHTTEDLLADKEPKLEVDLTHEGFEFNLVWAFALLALLLFLFLKYGSSGNLFTRDRSKKLRSNQLNQNWELAEESVSPSNLLAQVRSMADRRGALILLLRHSLLSAGSATNVRFARTDTEREAFGRVPEQWPYFSDLHVILRASELGHYGGRVIDDDVFDQCLSAGAKILAKGTSI